GGASVHGVKRADRKDRGHSVATKAFAPESCFPSSLQRVTFSSGLGRMRRSGYAPSRSDDALQDRCCHLAEWRYSIRHMAKRERLNEPVSYKLSAAEVRPKTGYAVTAREGAGPVTIGTVRKGLSIDVFKSVATNLEMSDRELARALNIPSRTFDRRL